MAGRGVRFPAPTMSRPQPFEQSTPADDCRKTVYVARGSVTFCSRRSSYPLYPVTAATKWDTLAMLELPVWRVGKRGRLVRACGELGVKAPESLVERPSVYLLRVIGALLFGHTASAATTLASLVGAMSLPGAARAHCAIGAGLRLGGVLYGRSLFAAAYFGLLGVLRHDALLPSSRSSGAINDALARPVPVYIRTKPFKVGGRISRCGRAGARCQEQRCATIRSLKGGDRAASSFTRVTVGSVGASATMSLTLPF